MELLAGVDESEAVVLSIATGVLDRQDLSRWLADHQSLCPALGWVMLVVRLGFSAPLDGPHPSGFALKFQGRDIKRQCLFLFF